MHTEIAIIGGSFGGMLAAARIREAGFDDFKIIEKGRDFGGLGIGMISGASCDIESPHLFPFAWKTGFIPKRKYTNAPETLEYCGVIAERFNLYENSILQTEIYRNKVVG